MRLTQPLTQPLTRRVTDLLPSVLVRAGGGSAPADVFPQPGVAVDLDFIGRRYYWNGARRSEADFTTFVLNGATFGAQGLDFSTCSVNPSVTIAIATLNVTMPPFVMGIAGYFLSTPAASRAIVELDDGTNNDRFIHQYTAAGLVNLNVTDNNVSQANVNPGSVGPSVSRYGLAVSAQLNEVLTACNGTAGTADVAATMPTATTLRLGCGVSATTFAPGILSRLWIYSTVKTQSEINAISTQIRDAPATPSWIWAGVAADFDFIRRQYYWNGLTRSEANFATLVLNGATWGAQGLDFSTCSTNPDITILLTTLNITMPPCVYAVGGYFSSTPATARTLLQFDDGTNNERWNVNMTATPSLQVQTIDGGVTQASVAPTVTPSAARFGLAYSGQLNDVLVAANGTASTADNAATMPTVTTLRLGKSNAATTFPPGIISRLWIFSAVKTQPQINQLSIDIRDAA